VKAKLANGLHKRIAKVPQINVNLAKIKKMGNLKKIECR
jgi:hypothetical protein